MEWGRNDTLSEGWVLTDLFVLKNDRGLQGCRNHDGGKNELWKRSKLGRGLKMGWIILSFWVCEASVY